MPVSSGGVFLDLFCSAGLAAVPRKLMGAFYREIKSETRRTRRELLKVNGFAEQQSSIARSIDSARFWPVGLRDLRVPLWFFSIPASTCNTLASLVRSASRHPRCLLLQADRGDAPQRRFG